MAEKPGETRADYPHFLEIPIRLRDVDVYGHVNNTVYLQFFDTVINAYLIEEGGLDMPRGKVIGVAVETMCRFHAEIDFPGRIKAGLRVKRIGSSSVTYEVGIFKPGLESPAATGHFVHVFIERESRKPTPIPAAMRAAMERLLVGED